MDCIGDMGCIEAPCCTSGDVMGFATGAEGVEVNKETLLFVTAEDGAVWKSSKSSSPG